MNTARSALPRLCRTLMVGTFLSLVPLTGMALAEDAVVATVDGVKISERDVAAVIADLGEALADKTPEQVRDYAITYLIDLELIAKKAREAGLDKDPEYAARVSYLQNKALLELHLERVGDAAVSDDAAKKLYDRLVGEREPEKEVRARHILVKTEDEAKAVVAELKGGKDFAEVAKEKSTDPGSGPDGGDLGYFTKDRMVPEFAEAAFSMKPGETSAPVKSQFGWHVIKVEDTREKAPPSFEEVKEQLLSMVGQEAQRDEVLAARAAAKIERMKAEETKAE